MEIRLHYGISVVILNKMCGIIIRKMIFERRPEGEGAEKCACLDQFLEVKPDTMF